jgi:hypothetical protein
MILRPPNQPLPGDQSSRCTPTEADTGWLPEPLRTTDAQTGGGSAESEASTDALPAFLADAEDGGPEDPTDAEEHLTRSRRNDS